MRDGWKETTLGEVAEVNPETTKGMPPQQRIRYIDLSAVSADSGIDESAVIDYELHSAPGRARRVVRHGDVLVSTVRPYLRGFAVVPRQLDGAVASTGFTVLRSREGLSLPGFVWSIVSKADFADRLMERATGSNYPAVRPNDIAEQVVLLPPLVVQRRVVDLVDAVDTYATAAAARADALREARNAMISDRLRQGANAGWVPTTLGEAAEVTIGRQRSPKNATGEHMTAYMRAANVKDGYLDLSDVKEMNFSPQEQAIYGLRPGDVLVTEGCGSLNQLGACAIWDGNGSRAPVCFQNTLIRLRSTERTDHGFLGLWGQWAFETGLFRSIASGTNIFHLGVEQTRRLPLHLPPLPMQRELSTLAAAFGNAIEKAALSERAARTARAALLDELLSGQREVPESYDELVGLVA